MFGLIAAESAIFTIFVVAYIFYIGKSLTGPIPNEVLRVPVFYTICLLSSSLTIHLATRALRRGNINVFSIFWFVTLALGATFLFGTAKEWHHLIYDEGLTISTNLFGTTYYSLVGLHALHVTAGLVALFAVLAFTLLKPSAGRTALLVACGLLLALMGVSRIDLGQHWFSDVMGAYMFGSLWLALTIRIYRWGKPRFFRHQPVAPEAPPAPTPGGGA